MIYIDFQIFTAGVATRGPSATTTPHFSSVMLGCPEHLLTVDIRREAEDDVA
jgi:hypothetical protein